MPYHQVKSGYAPVNEPFCASSGNKQSVFKAHQLQAIFYDNVGLMSFYDSILTDKLQPALRKIGVNMYQSSLKNAVESNDYVHTSFHCKGLAQTSTWDMTEVEWTWRLYYSLQPYLPLEANASCLCEEGKNFRDIQSRYSKLAFSRMY